MVRARLAVSAVVLALALGPGCLDTRYGPNMEGLDVPVLVGPVHRIGGGSGDPGRVVRTVEGKACIFVHTAASASNAQTRWDYYAEDDIASGIRAAAAGVSGCVVTVKDIKVVQHYHFSLFVWESRYVWLESEIRSAAPVESTR